MLGTVLGAGDIEITELTKIHLGSLEEWLILRQEGKIHGVILDHLVMPEMKIVLKTIDGNMSNGYRSNRKHSEWTEMEQLERQNKVVLDCKAKHKIKSVYVYTNKAKRWNKLING